MKKHHIIILLLFLLYIYAVLQPPKDSKPNRHRQEEQDRVDQYIDTRCSGPYCY